MKKSLSLLLIFALALMCNQNETNAKETSFEPFDTVVDYSEFINKDWFYDITDYEQDTLITEYTTDGKVVYNVRLGSDGVFTRYGEWFKQQEGKWFNYRESIEKGIKTSKELYVESYEAVDYRYDATKCSASSNFTNDSCQSKIRKSIDFYYIQGTRKQQEIKITYPNNQYVKDNTYASVNLKIIDRDNLKNDFKIVVSRDNKNRINKIKYYEYFNNKLSETTETIKINPKGDIYDSNNVQAFGIITKTYDDKNKLRRYAKIKDYDYTEVAVDYRLYNYHKNGKISTTSREKANKNGELYYNVMKKYNSKGKKQKQISYKYKNDKRIARTEYVYNSKGTLKGKAYKYITTYNKKQKAIKTTKYYYNKKAKVYKKAKVKHRIDFIVEEYDNEDMWF